MQMPASWFTPGNKLILDLGDVGDIAEVSVNGKSLGTLWKPPYRIDATSALRAGANQLEIKVTNEWSNRIAGDARGGQRVLSGGGGGRGGRGGGRGLAPSGLIGPVTVVSQTVSK